MRPRPRDAIPVHQRELLHAFAGIHFARVEVALGIDGQRVDPVELAGHAAVIADFADLFPRFPIVNPDLVVSPIGDEDVLFLSVVRKRPGAASVIPRFTLP